MSSKLILDPELVLTTYHKHNGNKTSAAKELGIHRGTLKQMLEMWGADKPISSGSVAPLKHNVLPLPPEGTVFRYICTAAQNNTRVFAKFLKNLEVYRDWHEGNGNPCRLMVSRFTYNKAGFVSKQKPGMEKASDLDSCWFDSALDEYVCDDPARHGTCRWQLAPDLFWCAELQVEPTATRPASGLGTYTGTASCIIPHTKLCIESVPVVQGTDPKFVFTTGAVTSRNYIQKKAGLKAEFHHVFSACLVEVNSDGDFWVRHLVGDRKGEFYDCPGGEVIKVTKDGVTKGHRAEAINFGDTHVAELPEDRKNRYWVGTPEEPAVIDCLRPKYQIHNDLFSMRSRSHHEMKSLEKMLKKYLDGDDKVEDELQETAEFLSCAERSFCTTVVVCSNHDRHLERYLDEVSYKVDLPNIEWFLEAQLARVKAIKSGEDWQCLEWGLRRIGCPETVRFLRIDEPFFICKNHPIACHLHGDIGANGARGSTTGLAKAGNRINKGHSHILAADEGVWSAGACSLDHGYNKGGLTSWSIAHVVTWESGRRCGLIERAGRLWA
jgi:hypothetical protein